MFVFTSVHAAWSLLQVKAWHTRMKTAHKKLRNLQKATYQSAHCWVPERQMHRRVRNVTVASIAPVNRHHDGQLARKQDVCMP